MFDFHVSYRTRVRLVVIGGLIVVIVVGVVLLTNVGEATTYDPINPFSLVAVMVNGFRAFIHTLAGGGQ